TVTLTTALVTFDPWLAISREEFVARQARAREAAREAGFDGAVVYSRGGAFVDMHADVLYLTNHYSQQPYVGDEAGIGSARSHGVCILPVDGPTTVVVDVPWWRKDLVVADDIRPSIHVTPTVVEALKQAGLADGRLALVGASYMTAAAYLGLAEGLPDADLVRADQLVEKLRLIKSPAELEIIRRACAVGNATLEALVDAVVEGATEAQAVGEASRVLISQGGVLYDAAAGSGPWAHQYTHARLPSADPNRRFERGDLFHVDCYGAYGGYLFDFARSRVVGDDPTDEQLQLLDAVIEPVEATCAQIKPGMTAGEVYAITAEWLANNEFVSSIPEEEPEMESFPAVGHGLGLMWEAPWLVENDPMVIERNMYIAVEVLLGHPSVGGAQFEHNGLVTEGGFEVLTTARSRWW
ncbi:MAG: Xaa-Pro peptidase family protein, partial [Actinomycetota bacterium]